MRGLRANSGLSNCVGGVNARVLVVFRPPMLRSEDSIVRFFVSLQAHQGTTGDSGKGAGAVVWQGCMVHVLVCCTAHSVRGVHTVCWPQVTCCVFPSRKQLHRPKHSAMAAHGARVRELSRL